MNARSVIAVLLLLVYSMSFAADPSRMTRDNYNKVKLGDNEERVIRCLGQASTSAWENEDGKCLEWEKEHPYAWIHVVFRDGKVISKSQAGL